MLNGSSQRFRWYPVGSTAPGGASEPSAEPDSVCCPFVCADAALPITRPVTYCAWQVVTFRPTSIEAFVELSAAPVPEPSASGWHTPFLSMDPAGTVEVAVCERVSDIGKYTQPEPDDEFGGDPDAGCATNPTVIQDAANRPIATRALVSVARHDGVSCAIADCPRSPDCAKMRNVATNLLVQSRRVNGPNYSVHRCVSTTAVPPGGIPRCPRGIAQANG